MFSVKWSADRGELKAKEPTGGSKWVQAWEGDGVEAVEQDSKALGPGVPHPTKGGNTHPKDLVFDSINSHLQRAGFTVAPRAPKNKLPRRVECLGVREQRGSRWGVTGG